MSTPTVDAEAVNVSETVPVRAEPVYGSPRDFEGSNPYPEFQEIYNPKEEKQGLIKKTLESKAFKTYKVIKKIYDTYGNIKSFLKFLAVAGVVAAVAVVVIGAHDLSYEHSTVVTENDKCSQIGVNIMKQQGNAVDAAIATSFCSGVLHPMSSGIGGGGIMMIKNHTDAPIVIDYREIAPKGADESLYRGPNARNRKVGNDAIAIPATVKGLYVAWTKYGTMPWSALVLPAARLAKQGYPASKLLAKSAQGHKSKIQYGSTELKAVFMPGGIPVVEGQVVKMEALGRTLEYIASSPLNWFSETGYMGDLQFLNLLNLHIADTAAAAKQVIVRTPLQAKFLPHTVYVPPPVSSGSLLIAFLNFMKAVDIKTTGENKETIHTIAEALKLVYAQQPALGDPDNAFNLDMSDTVAKITTKDLVTKFIDDKYKKGTTLALAEYSSTIPYYENIETGVSGTASTIVVDRGGMVVAMSESIGDAFGSAVMLPNTGILMNNHMGDFSMYDDSSAINPNSIAEFKRPVTWMSPTIVTDSDDIPVLALAASGGDMIASGLAQVANSVQNFLLSPHKALSRPRMHHDRSTNKLLVEKGIAEELKFSLAQKQHKVKVVDFFDTSAVQVVLMQGSKLYPAADPRKNDAPPHGY
eukprot:c959_g1_i2.p1 GENE.c959_g1_i2~~c959_g1_i2.p1  ORF type:complete len:640 (-),score=136.28 c959_g1_i2:552-2471(-)